MIRVRYEDMNFHYITNHYDYHLSGTCWYNGKLAEFDSMDETDYQAMTDACPYCSDQTEDIHACNCRNAPDVFCYIKEIPLYKRIYWRFKLLRILFWFMWKFRRTGFVYFGNWYYGKSK